MESDIPVDDYQSQLPFLGLFLGSRLVLIYQSHAVGRHVESGPAFEEKPFKFWGTPIRHPSAKSAQTRNRVELAASLRIEQFNPHPAKFSTSSKLSF